MLLKDSKHLIITAIAALLHSLVPIDLTYWCKPAILTLMAVILERKVSEFSLEIAKAVRFHRKQANLSQQQLAEYAAIGKTAVFNIEHGKATVQLQTLLKVLNILNIKLIIDAPLNYEEADDAHS